MYKKHCFYAYEKLKTIETKLCVNSLEHFHRVLTRFNNSSTILDFFAHLVAIIALFCEKKKLQMFGVKHI